MPSPPSTISSASSSSEGVSEIPVPATGSTRDPPLQPPRPLFFIDRKASQDPIETEPRRDPFRTPDGSVPPTPAAVHDNPFSPPASILSTGSIGSLGSVAEPHVTISSQSRVQSRVSVHSSLRSSNLDLPSSRPPLPSRASSQIRDSFMSPPAMTRRNTAYESNVASRLSVAAPKSKRMRSSMLAGTIEKPWVGEKDVHGRMAWWITYLVAFLGVAGSALRCYFAWKDVPRVGNLCLIMEDNFDTFDTEFTWQQEVDMGGFGNGEFEMTTNSPNNSFVEDGKLYIVPTLTSDVIGRANVLNGFTYNVTGCTSTNLTSCGAVSNQTAGTVINPVMSARLTTKQSHHIQYGKVEIVAKLPRGDWLWPALWMLPVDDSYGPWPMSGEIDIMESRGNSPEYKAQGRDVVRGSLNWGPFSWLNGVSKTYGWWNDRRQSYDQGFHTYSVEWNEQFIRIYVDTRLHKMLQISFNEPFFQRGDFPPFVANGTQTIATPNPWVNGTTAAPFDKPFYVIMNVAAGGTNGWFPDGVGGKPWFDSSVTAMSEFANAQDTWYSTWATDPKDRAMVIDSVKMWQKC
ncbi:hypothetical protein EW026_g5660 [Hermanssonia centrifuga]|uniref:GH16 domain-containing protein n=1 Tax=Hermanssonia centrifuga TaxID=98765 RepID=A0A4S4KDE1_9APHY|nr:hypothetical protein EW026_g5660 [Hermanssonia centrifuga]